MSLLEYFSPRVNFLHPVNVCKRFVQLNLYSNSSKCLVVCLGGYPKPMLTNISHGSSPNINFEVEGVTVGAIFQYPQLDAPFGGLVFHVLRYARPVS